MHHAPIQTENEKASEEAGIIPDRPQSDEGTLALAVPKVQRLNDYERLVLARLNEVESDFCIPFAPIVRDTGLTRAQVRLACRSLFRKGLALYARGLWNEDGEPRGSGYGPTPAGQAAALAREAGQ